MAGRGSVVRELIRHWPNSQVEAIELNQERFDVVRSANTAGYSYCFDFLDKNNCNVRTFDLGITNPSFALAQPTIEKTIQLCRETVMLVRLGFLASMERSAFWTSHPADIYVLSKRPSFCASLKCGAKPKCDWKETSYLDAPRPKECPGCGGKVTVVTSDSSDYCWAVWGPGRGGRWKRLEIKGDDGLEH